jgi:methylase of polypeptide subunit release factors
MTLLLHHELHKAFRGLSSELLGVDISTKALKLARDNLKHVGTISPKSKVHFKRANVLAKPGENYSKIPSVHNIVGEGQDFDILVANPPYISTQQFYRETARSVRAFEPRLALVPGPSSTPDLPHAPAKDSSIAVDEGDIFYPRIADVAESVGAKLVLLEVGDSEQAERVAKLLASRRTSIEGVSQPVWDAIEIWRDGITMNGVATRRLLQCGRFSVPIIGPDEATHGRTVVCWRKEANSWLTMESHVA